MIALILLLYGVPVYLIFFHYRLIPLTAFWKVFLGIPPAFILVFLWFALGRYTPTTRNAYVQAPVVQGVSEVSGLVTELAVKDHQAVSRGATLFQVDPRPYQYRVDQANARLVDVQENALTLFCRHVRRGRVHSRVASVIDTILSWMDYFHPKPSLLIVLMAVVAVIVVVVYLRRNRIRVASPG